MKAHKLFIILIFSTNVFLGKGQDQHFSQFFSTPLYLSPSLAGATDGTRIIANYRNQWPSIPNSYINYSFSVDHYLKDYKSGIGLLVMKNTEGGVFSSTSIGATYTYNIKINNFWRINPGLGFSNFTSFLDWSALEFGDQIYRNSSTSVELDRGERVNYYDFAGSILAYSEQFWFGMTFDHLLAINPQFTTEPTYPGLKFSVYGGAKLIHKSKRFTDPDRSYSLAFIYKNQDGYQQLDIGSNYERESLRFGLWLRGATDYLGTPGLNAFVLLVGYTYKQFKFNYSYDISTSRLMTLTGGAHELSLMYKIDWVGYNKKIKRKAIPCPEF